MQNYAQLEACLLVSLVLEGLAPLVVALGVCVAVCVVPLRAQRDEAVFLLADAKQHDATAKSKDRLALNMTSNLASAWRKRSASMRNILDVTSKLWGALMASFSHFVLQMQNRFMLRAAAAPKQNAPCEAVVENC